MGTCDLCGKNAELFKAKVEDTLLTVCKSCGKFGKVLEPVVSSKQVIKEVVKPRKYEIVEVIVPDYSTIIRKAREKQGLTQKDFARKLNEKESFIQKVETGRLEPSISTAKKLEVLLNVKLIEQVEEPITALKKTSSKPLTIGDVINNKMNF